MEDLIIARRSRLNNTVFKANTQPLFRVEFPTGRFIFYEATATTLNFADGMGLMFAFGKQQQNAYVFIETPEEDNYLPKSAGEGRKYWRFTSKDLATNFAYVFDIRNKKFVYFELDKQPNEKGMYKLTLINK